MLGAAGRAQARRAVDARVLPHAVAGFYRRALAAAVDERDATTLAAIPDPRELLALLEAARGCDRVIELGRDDPVTPVALALDDPRRRVTAFRPPGRNVPRALRRAGGPEHPCPHRHPHPAAGARAGVRGSTRLPRRDRRLVRARAGRGHFRELSRRDSSREARSPSAVTATRPTPGSAKPSPSSRSRACPHPAASTSGASRSRRRRRRRPRQPRHDVAGECRCSCSRSCWSGSPLAWACQS